MKEVTNNSGVVFYTLSKSEERKFAAVVMKLLSNRSVLLDTEFYELLSKIYYGKCLYGYAPINRDSWRAIEDFLNKWSAHELAAEFSSIKENETDIYSSMRKFRGEEKTEKAREKIIDMWRLSWSEYRSRLASIGNEYSEFPEHKPEEEEESDDGAFYAECNRVKAEFEDMGHSFSDSEIMKYVSDYMKSP